MDPGCAQRIQTPPNSDVVLWSACMQHRYLPGATTSFSILGSFDTLLICKNVFHFFSNGFFFSRLEASHAAFLQRSDLELILENCPHLIYLDIKHCNHIGVLDCSKHEKLTTIVAVGCKVP